LLDLPLFVQTRRCLSLYFGRSVAFWFHALLADLLVQIGLRLP
jgi:hypothetical protein